ncbi:MAG: hypothetical protein C0197_05310 [Caldimicrobium thiodismutans]|uniref:Uncharacterized protein n=1 Tax=Caldimicrobium thiodismutans TaxID=1653476 RepID=A0A2N7PIM1_9BACT|nr:MAG: hypothetical protein C0197_05310 [Caldimicrobium thiodismutans]
MTEKELCKTLALGSLVRGYFHNLRGTLQGLSFQLQILYMKKDTLLSPSAHSNIEKAMELLQKLQNQLEVALEDLNNTNQGPWNLREIMEKELLFWEANLFFKHKIKKEIYEEREVLITLPLNELKGMLCLLEEKLYFSLKEGTYLRIIIGESGKRALTFEMNEPLEEEILQKLANLSGYLQPYASLSLSPTKVELEFKS